MAAWAVHVPANAHPLHCNVQLVVELSSMTSLVLTGAPSVLALAPSVLIMMPAVLAWTISVLAKSPSLLALAPPV